MKRFTETEKWRDSWFRKLPSSLKLSFFYLVENCDASGVWDPDFELAEFAIGEKIDWDALKTALGNKLKVLNSGKWHLVKFIEFQYGELSIECRPHVKILSILKGHGIPYRKGIQRVSNTHKEEDKDKEEDKEEDRKRIGPEEIYAAYPRKEAKAAGLKAIEKAIEGFGAEKLLERTKAYSSAIMAWSANDLQYIPHAATWFNRGSFEDDPKNWSRKNNHAVPWQRPTGSVEDQPGF